VRCADFAQFLRIAEQVEGADPDVSGSRRHRDPGALADLFANGLRDPALLAEKAAAAIKPVHHFAHTRTDVMDFVEPVWHG
jgi:hypothetical protein